jgi:hypothetical protein
MWGKLARIGCEVTKPCPLWVAVATVRHGEMLVAIIIIVIIKELCACVVILMYLE